MFCFRVCCVGILVCAIWLPGSGALLAAEAYQQPEDIYQNFLGEEDESGSVYFSVLWSAGEYAAYYSDNNISRLVITISRESIDQSTQEEIASIEFGDPSVFSIETWQYRVDNAASDRFHYYVSLTADEEECGIRWKIPIRQVDPPAVDNDLPEAYRGYECGVKPTIPDIQITDHLTAADANRTTITIDGIPIIISGELEPAGQPGHFNGSGILPLPFGKQSVAVTFTVELNTQYQVLSGSVSAISDNHSAYPEFTVNMPVATVGGPICQEPEVGGVDDYGFDPVSGIHSGTGTTLDRYGYDVNGFYGGGGSKYNHCDCDRNSLDRNRQPCNIQCEVNEAAQTYAEEHGERNNLAISAVLEKISAAAKVRRAALNCAEKRTTLVDLVDQLAPGDAEAASYILGPESAYSKLGMHRNFAAAPTPLQIGGIERDQKIMDIEAAHIALFYCDTADYYAFEQIRIADSLLEAEERLEGIQNYVDGLIRDWTSYEYSLYNEEEAFTAWLTSRIWEYLYEVEEMKKSPYDTPSMTYQSELTTPIDGYSRFNERNLWPPPGPTYASLDGFIYGEAREVIDPYQGFADGETVVNGLHRAFYLEALADYHKRQPAGNRRLLLPVQVGRTVGNTTFNVLIDEVTLAKESGGGVVGKLDAYLLITDPETQRRMVFAAQDLTWGPSGLLGDADLYLYNNVEVRLSNSVMLRLDGGNGGGARVSWSCGGFESLSILNAELEFCRKLITPLDHQYEPLPEEENYRLQLNNVTMTAWPEFVVEVSAAPFAVTGNEDIAFEASNFVLDFSSTLSEDFVPLSGYVSPFYDEEKHELLPLWKGIYIRNLGVRLPAKFAKDDEGQMVSARFNDVLIDGTGFTGGVTLQKELLSLEKGNLGGWAFSIDRFSMAFLQNQLSGGEMGGELVVPLFEEPMPYDAFIRPDNGYSFKVTVPEQLTAKALLAEVELAPNSTISIEYTKEKGVNASAILSGKMAISSSKEGGHPIAAKLPTLHFQRFTLNSSAPYLETGNWYLEPGASLVEKEAKIEGFPIVLKDVQVFQPTPDEFGLRVGLGLDLAEKLGVAAGGGFAIVGRCDRETGIQRWVHERISLEGFEIDAEFPGAKVSGGLTWYDQRLANENLWGKGFRGIVQAEFAEGLGVKVNAAAQFGTTDHEAATPYKYFFVDGMADLGAIGNATGVVQLKGFGGGIAYNMDIDPAAVAFGQGAGGSSIPALGDTYSGTRYTPHPDKGLGLRATAILAAGSEEMLNGTVGLTVEFNNRFGLDQITFDGSVQALAPIDVGIRPDFVADVPGTAGPTSVDAAISAYMSMKFDFRQRAYHGNFEAFVNAEPFLYGTGAGGRAASAEFHADPRKWYLYVGTPTASDRYSGPASLTFKVPLIDADIKTGGYFCVGTVVPPTPPLPLQVRRLAGEFRTDPMLRQSGAGMVFGANMQLALRAEADKFASIELLGQFGFDVMLRKYKNLFCSGSSDPIGLRGWYASGQAYAYLSGRVKVLKFTLAEAGIAAALKARLPNPFFAEGAVGLEYKVLGIIGGKMNLNLKLGNDCQIVSDTPNDGLNLAVIQSILPGDGETGFSTLQAGSVQFALPIGETYRYSDLGGAEKSYRAELVSASFTVDGNEIPTNRKWDAAKYNLSVEPTFELPANREITFAVVVHVFEAGKTDPIVQHRTVVFETGDELHHLPASNIAYTYPIDGMGNFYTQEYQKREGYIQLRRSQAKLLQSARTRNYLQLIRLTSAAGDSYTVAYTYDALRQRITYPLDPERLQPGTLYKVELVRRYERLQPRRKTTSLRTLAFNGRNLPANYQVAAEPNSDASSPPTPESNNVTEPEAEIREAVMYQAYFRVSQFPTFVEKMKVVANSEAINTTGIRAAGEITYLFTLSEPFDALESQPNSELLSVQAYGNDPYLKSEAKAFFNQDVLNTGCVGNLTEALEAAKTEVSFSPHTFSVRQESFERNQYTFSYPRGGVGILRYGVASPLRKFYSQGLACVSHYLNRHDIKTEGGRGSSREPENTALDAYAKSLRSYVNGPFPTPDPNDVQTVLLKYVLPGGLGSSQYILKF